MKVIVCTKLRPFQSCKDVMLSNDCPGKLSAPENQARLFQHAAGLLCRKNSGQLKMISEEPVWNLTLFLHSFPRLSGHPGSGMP